MRLDNVTAIIEALNGAGVRYIVVGGLAVAAHGYLRHTNDLDLVVQLQSDNIQRAFAALEGLEYRPIVPVTVERFLDIGNENRPVCEKGLMLLPFHSDKQAETPVKVFVREPFDFDVEYEAALRKSLFDRLVVRVVSLPTLIRMKEDAGRTVDIIDVEDLRMRLEDIESDRSRDERDFDWSLTTWDGNRREHMRRCAEFTMDESIHALEEMGKVMRKLKVMRLRRI